MVQQTPDTQTIDGITYQLDSDTPYTGKHTMYYDNGDKFSEGNDPTKPMNDPKKQVAKVRAISNVYFNIHDLRRTFITIAESLDVPQYALKQLINHKDARDVTAGYIIMDVERLRQPMNDITDYILEHMK